LFIFNTCRQEAEIKLDPKLVTAAKCAAEKLNGDNSSTEAALLSQLLTAFKTADYQKQREPAKTSR